MAKKFTLDAIREVAERKYGSTEIDLGDGTVVELQSILRLNSSDRKSIQTKLKELEELSDSDETGQDGELDEGLVEIASDILLMVAKSNGKKLIREIGGDLVVTMQVLEAWLEDTQPGEASSSPNS